MVLNAETFDRPRHTEITIACCEHLGTQHAVIHGELFALHLLVSVGTAVELQQPRSYIHFLEVFFVPVISTVGDTYLKDKPIKLVGGSASPRPQRFPDPPAAPTQRAP